jgi:hypothetical protein
MTFIEKDLQMFTLPVDKILPAECRPDGKTIQQATWNLTVLIEPGVNTNETKWCPGQGSSYYDQGNIFVEIFLGDSCLFKAKLDTKKLMFSKNIPDTRDPQRKNLIVKLSGKPNNPDLIDDNHVAIKIDVLIEDLSIMPLFENHGYFISDSDFESKIAGEFIGENGSQVVEIYTPIYVWLLQHQQTFGQYSQKG